MDTTNQCKLCNLSEAKYVCPRCNVSYCSLGCYQSQVHAQCSESFYRDCVVEQIENGGIDPQSRNKMMEILKRVQNIEEHFDNQEIQDSDDEDSEEELAVRLSGVNLNDADLVWQKLTMEERCHFEELLRSGDVTEIVPSWQPWWLYQKAKMLVEDLQNPNPEFPHNIPKILQNIQSLSSLSKISPSPFVRWGVVNVLAAYSVTARVYNGDHFESSREATTTLMSLSGNLSANEVFEEPESAVAAVYLSAISNHYMVTGVDEVLLKEDVRMLVEGPSESQKNVYVLAALSDIHSLLSSAKKKIKKDNSLKVKGEFSNRFPDASNVSIKVVTIPEVNKQLKKVEFFLSWTTEYF